MSVSVAEYFGQRTDTDANVIKPVSGNHKCPFMGGLCQKMAKSSPNKPVCSVRKADGTVWIV